MKKLLLICLVALFACTKGYGQLMQANTISSSNKAYAGDTVAYINNVESKTNLITIYTPPSRNVNLVEQINQIDSLKKLLRKTEKLSEQLRKLDPGSRKLDSIRREEKRLTTEITKINENLKTELKGSQVYHDEIYTLLIKDYKSYIEKLDKELDEYNKNIEKNDKEALTQLDTLLHTTHGIAGNHTKDYRDIVIENIEIKSLYKQLKITRDTFNKHFTYLSDIKQSLSYIETMEVYQAIVKLQDDFNKLYVKLSAQERDFKKSYEDYVKKFNQYAKNVNEQIKKAAKEQPSSDQYASALAGINKVFGDNGTLTPTVSLVAQKKFNSSETGSFYGEVRLFTGGSTGDKLNNGTSNLFVPEASTFGFMANFTFGFISAHKSAKKSEETGLWEQRLGVNLGFYYLGKKLQPDTLTSFNTNIFHIKAGLQYILIPHVLSAYINTNAMLVSTNVNRVEQYYSSVSKLRTFTSFGIESYLDLNEVKDFHLLINLGFVAVNNDVRSWTDNHDSVIPSAKVSLVKTFGW